MIQVIRKSKITKVLAAFAAVNLLVEIINPAVAFALTGGPSQPEVQSFEPVGTSEMVDLFSGDFTYNIPLLDVEGYPINLSYHSGISMDQEASWVGLGWNINAGVITRNMRGLPDDFAGDMVKKSFNIADNITCGGGLGVGAEIAGFEKLGIDLSAGIGVKYNNYRGLSTEKSFGLNFSLPGKSPLNVGLGVTSSSADGLGVDANVSLQSSVMKKSGADMMGTLSVGTSFNSRQGLKSLNIGMGVSEYRTHAKAQKQGGRKNTTAKVAGINGGASISFGMQTYVPNIDLPLYNETKMISVKVGGTAFSIDGTVDVNGYYSKQRLARQSESVPAFGYLYSEIPRGSNYALLDFNREKDGGFSVNTPALPVTNFSYDVYSVAGQGIGGMYRPFRGDVGYVYDRTVINSSTSGNLGLEAKFGNIAQGGADVTVSDVTTTAGKWASFNRVPQKMSFRGKNPNSEYEPYYFMQAGEKAVDEETSIFTTLGGFDARRFLLSDPMGYEVMARNILVDRDGANGTTISNPYRAKRRPRNQAITTITKSEYEEFAVDDSYYSIFQGNAKRHHIAEITTLRPDGSRYVFGLPAYNTMQREVTFNASGRSGSNVTGLVTYGAGDNSTGNKRGKDNYYSCTELPPYAHSYLLTTVLSHDYVDLEADGPTDDDLGTYTKFIYDNSIGDYQWRVPYNTNSANYNEALKTKVDDDQGNYIYGTKDLFYLKKIVTKNYIALFTLEDRADGYEVAGENGDQGGRSTKLLKKISLYSKKDYGDEDSDNPLPTAVPIKEVHFVYNYSLCDGVDNNNAGGGKLTLEKLFFTYGNSHKGRLSPYEFTYSTENPDYNLKAYDRWGNYKENKYFTQPLYDGLSNAEFPYVEQDETVANASSHAWNLTSISLPSGGTITVEYESDDYAYVQDRRAMQMFKITGVGEFSSSNPEISAPMTKDQPYYLFFEVPAGTTRNHLENNYFNFTGEVYFRIKAKVNFAGYEYVSGYADIDVDEQEKMYGINPLYSNYAYVKLKEPDGADLGNPLAQAAVQFGRLHTPKLAYDYNRPYEGQEVGEPESFLKKLVNSALGNLFEAIDGPNDYLFKKGLGQNIEENQSWIRLSNPTGFKYGGGCRVKTLKLKDNWSQINSGQTYAEDFETGQEYEYTTTLSDGTPISSGVASYEPMVGADENPFRMPVNFNNNKDVFLAPDDRYYMEEPFGESFFPAPGIGYSKVTVKSLDKTDVTKHATGKVVHEFFTAKDYPVKTRRTDLDMEECKTNLLSKLLRLNIKDYMTASQGFVVELNDMHGKEKAQWVYAEGQDVPISGVEYFYKDNGTITDNDVRVRGDRLSNDMTVIYKNSAIATAQVGVDYDFVADMREHLTIASSVGAQINLYGFIVGIFPIVLPPVWPTSSVESMRFRSISATKVINRYGILEETVAYDLGSKVSVKNLALDAETGEVLVTQTQNEFEDDIYTFNYPAHWAYKGMGSAYKNVGMTFTGTVSAGKITGISNPDLYFVPGDELAVYDQQDNSFQEKLWVTDVTQSDISVINYDNGTLTASGSVNIKIMRSGRRNMQGVSVGSFTSMINPLDADNDEVLDNNIGPINQNFGILNAGAVEYSDQWEAFCACMPQSPQTEEYNPYVLGEKGIWRSKRTYTYLTGRDGSPSVNNTDIRNDGKYKFYRPFWVPPSVSSPEPIPEWEADYTQNKWIWTSEVTRYSPYGFEIENKDILDRYSSALYRYNNTLPIAVSSNAKYREIAYEGFEDYPVCKEGHFNFMISAGSSPEVTNTRAHSGKYSVKVQQGATVSTTYTLVPCPPQL